MARSLKKGPFADQSLLKKVDAQSRAIPVGTPMERVDFSCAMDYDEIESNLNNYREYSQEFLAISLKKCTDING